ncbi:MAG: hypothetical protein Q9213_008121 [Squamulea squamosa]
MSASQTTGLLRQIYLECFPLSIKAGPRIMGRELQKKKNKSSIPKVKHKPKSKKLNLKANPIVAANWYEQNANPLPKLPPPRPRQQTQRPRRRDRTPCLQPPSSRSEKRRIERFIGDCECEYYDAGAGGGEDIEG